MSWSAAVVVGDGRDVCCAQSSELVDACVRSAEVWRNRPRFKKWKDFLLCDVRILVRKVPSQTRSLEVCLFVEHEKTLPLCKGFKDGWILLAKSLYSIKNWSDSGKYQCSLVEFWHKLYKVWKDLETSRWYQWFLSGSDFLVNAQPCFSSSEENLLTLARY